MTPKIAGAPVPTPRPDAVDGRPLMRLGPSATSFPSSLPPPSDSRLDIEYTINDPTYYTRPWTTTVNARYTTGTELFEFICNENERSTKHMGPNIK
jgi:hypothetical protein